MHAEPPLDLELADRVETKHFALGQEGADRVSKFTLKKPHRNSSKRNINRLYRAMFLGEPLLHHVAQTNASWQGCAQPSL
jgi:hypothetical protein